METFEITVYSSGQSESAPGKFEEAMHDSMLRYSMRHLVLAGITAQQDITEAMQRAMHICFLAEINVKQHFKQVYVYDESTGMTHTDWLMSKKGFNLTLMQSPSLNDQIARWLWELV